MMKYRFVLAFLISLSTLYPLKSIASTIRVGIDLWPGYYPIVLAKHLGLFKKQGLNVNIVLPESTDNMLGQFTNGELDMVCVAMGDAFSLYKKDTGLRIVMITDESSGGDALLAKNDLKSISEINLKGKRIGTNLQGFGELFINHFLKQKKIDPSAVTLIHQEAANALNTLQSGEADIVHTWEPYVTEIQSFNTGRVVFDSGQTPGLIPDALLANGNFIKNNPDDLKKFISAWLEASAWWLNHLQAGNAIIESEMVMMPNSVNLKGVKLYKLQDNLSVFEPKDDMTSLYYVTNLYIKFFEKKGVIKKGFKADNILDSSFLPR